MTECTVGLYRGVEQYRNEPYCALWTQVDGLEQQTIFRITITRTNHGNEYAWKGPEVQKLGSKIEGFITGRPERIVIGKARLDASKLEVWATQINERRVRPPHELVVALLENLECSDAYRTNIRLRWSTIVQQWTDAQDMIIPSRTESERRRRPYGNRLVEKYDSSHHAVGNCPLTDGLIRVSEQRELYDPRSPPTKDPVRDGLFRRAGSRTPSPLQSPTTTPASLRSQLTEPASTVLHRVSTLPSRTKPPPSPLQLHSSHKRSPAGPSSSFGYSQSPRRASTFTNSMSPGLPDKYQHHLPRRRHDSCPASVHHELDPRLRPFEARKRAIFISQDQHVKPPGPGSGRTPPSAFRPPRSKTDRRRSESRPNEGGKSSPQAHVVKTVLTVLAATAMAVV